MLQDGILLVDSSVATNFQIQYGTTLPSTGNNIGELFFLTAGTVGLYVYNGSAYVPSATVAGTVAITGDATASGNIGTPFSLTLATVNSTVGSFGSASQSSIFSVNAKGLITSAGQTPIAIDTSQVISGTFADARIALSNVTQHQAALSIAESQVADANILARIAGNEAISGNWTFQTPVSGAGPTLDAHLATKQYVDNIASGLDPKASVRIATTANITLSGVQTIDGVSVVAGNRVLVKDQSVGSENGLYVAAAGAWTRSSDFDGTPASEVTSGSYVFATEGTANGAKGFVLVTADPITIGTTALVWSQVSAAPTSLAGTSLTGTTLSSNIVNSSLTSVGTLGSLAVTGAVTAGSFTGPLTGSVSGNVTGTLTGNASTATALQNARNINGVSFNGTADITVAAAAGTLTGTTLASNVVTSSLTSVGTLGSLVVTGSITAGSINATVSGNSSTATALATGRTFSATGDATGTSAAFDGTANASIPMTLATVNSTVGSFGTNAGVPAFTVNAKGLVTAVSVTAIAIPSTAVTDFAEAVQDVVGNASFLTGANGVTTTYTDGSNTLVIGLSAVPNASLANSSVTIGSTNIVLGGTSTTLAGLTSVTSAAFFGPLTGNVTGALIGNAATSTKLFTSVTINGVAFDGSANITVPAAAGTLTGTTLNATVTGSSLTSVGTLGSLAVTGAVTAGSFSGPLTGNSTGTHTGAVVGNASTATALQTARTINGTSFDGTSNITVTAAAGTLTGTTLNATVTGSSLTSVGTLGTLSVTGNVSAADPTTTTHLTTKSYVDNLVQGLSWKVAVKVGTTANITLSGTQTIDGIAVVANDRVLVKNQTTGAQNGVYVVSAGAWARATDFDASPSVGEVNGAAVFIQQGTTQAETGWVQTAEIVTIGTDAMTFVIFSATGGAVAKAGDTMTGVLTNSSGFVGPLTGAVTGNVTGAASLNVLKTGDTMTGTLVIAPVSAGDVSMTLSAAAAGSNTLYYTRNAGLTRWAFGKNNSTEAGANSGSDFAILRFNDAGTFIDTTFSINRASGSVALTAPMTNSVNTASNVSLLALTNSNAAGGSQINFSSNAGALTGYLGVHTGGSMNLVSMTATQLILGTNNLARLVIDASGNVGIGATASTSVSLVLNKPMTGGTSVQGILAQGAIQSDVTGTASYFSSFASTQSAAFSMTTLNHFRALQTTLGTGSTITQQLGFNVDATMVGGLNNYGFFGNLSHTTATISNVALTSNVVTITTASAHGYTAGMQVSVTATTNTAVNGTYTITSVTSTTFTYARTNANIVSVADTGSVISVGRWNTYNVGAAPNWFAGNVGIGSGKAAPATALDVNGTVTATAFVGSLTGAASLNVLKTGDTMTGQLNINSATASLVLNTTVGTTANTYLQTAGLTRWRFGKDANPESGSNAGSNFFINSLADDGSTLIGTALNINRSTLSAAFGGVVSATGGFVGSLTGASSLNVLKAGDTMTGFLTLSYANAGLTINGGASGNSSNLYFASTGGNRWRVGKDTAAESGSNAGSNWFMNAIADDGTTPVGTAFSIVRSTLAASFGGTVSAPAFSGPLTGNVTGSASLNVLKTGDTMTGALTINSGAPTGYLNLNSTHTTGSYIRLQRSSIADLLIGHFGQASGGTTTGVSPDALLLRASNGIAFSPGSGVPLMQLDASGNLGIGTTTTTQKFEVSGASAVARVSGTAGTSARLELSSATVVNWSLRSNNSAVSDFTIFQDATERMRIDNAGNVGIGAATPGQFVDIKKDQNATTFLRIQNSTSGTAAGVGISLHDGTTNKGQLLQYSAGFTTANQFFADSTVLNAGGAGGMSLAATNVTTGDIRFYSGGVAEKMRLNASGNLGIGTTTPQTALHVHSAAGGGDVPYITLTNAGTGQTATDGSFIGLTNTNELALWNREASIVRFGTSNAERLRITALGGVSFGGLGAGTAGQRLVSAGDAPPVWSSSVVVGNFTQASATASLSTTAQTSVDAMPHATNRTIKYMVEATFGSNFQSSELMVVTNGTVAYVTEYAIVYTSAAPLVTYDVDISGANVRLLATAATATTTLKILKTYTS